MCLWCAAPYAHPSADEGVVRAGTHCTSAEAAYLADISGPVTTALRRSQARTFRERAAPNGTSRGPVMLLLSRRLDVRAQTAETQAYLRALVPPDQDRSPIPASAYNVAGNCSPRRPG